MISQNYLTLPLYLPRICRLWSNWHEYLFDYLLRRRGKFRKSQLSVYKLRDGTRLVDTSGTLAGTMAVVFVRREYGELAQFKTIVDVGANLGCFAVYAAQRCPDAKIYCYEPQKQNFASLQRNIEINGLTDRVSAFPYAVASKSGRRDLAVTAESLVNSFYIIPDESGRETVDCTTLGEILETHKLETIDLLKLNCEGTEYEILESLSSEHLARISNVRLEYHNLEAQSRSGEWLVRFFRDRGFRIERFTRYMKRSGFVWATRFWVGVEMIEALPALLRVATV
jgi:FkbM family methyltransferase